MMLKDMLYADGSLNILVFHAINNVQNECFQQFMQIASMIGKYKLFPVYLFIFVGSAWMISRAKEKGSEGYNAYIKKINQVLLSLIVSFVVYVAWVSWLKHIMHMPRPFVALPEGQVFINEAIRLAEEPYVSFPSGHAAFSMMMLVALWPLLSKLEAFLGIMLVLTIGVSRVALGVHFPSDILMSWLVSLIVTCVTVTVCRKLDFKWLRLLR